MVSIVFRRVASRVRTFSRGYVGTVWLSTIHRATFQCNSPKMFKSAVIWKKLVWLSTVQLRYSTHFLTEKMYNQLSFIFFSRSCDTSIDGWMDNVDSFCIG